MPSLLDDNTLYRRMYAMSQITGFLHSVHAILRTTD